MPIEPDAAWDFDPDNVPTVQQLVQELTEQQQQQQQQADAGSGAARVSEVVQRLRHAWRCCSQ